MTASAPDLPDVPSMLPGLTNWTAVPAPAAAPARVEPAGLAKLMGSMGSAETGIVSAGSQPVSVEPIRPGHRSRVPEAFDRRRCNIPLPQRLERRNTGRRSDAVRCCSIYLSSDFSVSDCWFSPPPKNRGWRWFFGSRNSRNEQNETESQCLRGHTGTSHALRFHVGRLPSCGEGEAARGHL